MIVARVSAVGRAEPVALVASANAYSRTHFCRTRTSALRQWNSKQPWSEPLAQRDSILARSSRSFSRSSRSKPAPPKSAAPFCNVPLTLAPLLEVAQIETVPEWIRRLQRPSTPAIAPKFGPLEGIRGGWYGSLRRTNTHWHEAGRIRRLRSCVAITVN
jgi:hypothetical protein